jgi:hypothetical protein
LSFPVGRASPPLSPYNQGGSLKVQNSPPRSVPDERFKLSGKPPPGIQVQYGSVELDAYGQPLSPTNMLAFGQNSTGQSKSKENKGQSKEGGDNPDDKNKQALPNHILREPAGPPRLTGLSSYEFTTESGGLPSGIRYYGSTSNKKQSEVLDQGMVSKYRKLIFSLRESYIWTMSCSFCDQFCLR